MNQTSPLTLVDRLTLILDGLCRAVAARIAPGIAGWAMQVVMIRLVWTRVRRAEQKIKLLLERFRAGKLRVVSVARREAARGPRIAASASPARCLPRSFAWLLPMVPCEAANLASQLRVLLAEPEMQDLLEASAQARRVLAPVCRMLGIEAELLAPLEAVAPGGVRPARFASVPAPIIVDPAVALYRMRWGGD